MYHNCKYLQTEYNCVIENVAKQKEFATVYCLLLLAFRNLKSLRNLSFSLPNKLLLTRDSCKCFAAQRTRCSFILCALLLPIKVSVCRVPSQKSLCPGAQGCSRRNTLS